MKVVVRFEVGEKDSVAAAEYWVERALRGIVHHDDLKGKVGEVMKDLTSRRSAEVTVG